MAWSRNDSESRIDPRTGAGDDRQRLGVGVDAFLRAHVGEVRGDLVDGVERELEVLGARADGGRDLQRIGGGEHEHHVLGRFLERLQQRGFRAAAEHVHLVEDVHLLRAAGAEVGDALEQVAHLVDLAARRGVDLDHVERAALGDGDAALALAARIAVVAAIGAVQRLRQQAGGGGLAGAAGSGEEVRMPDPAVAHGVAQRGAHVLLADQLGEALRPVLAVERLIGHQSGPFRSGVPAVRPGLRSMSTGRL